MDIRVITLQESKTTWEQLYAESSYSPFQSWQYLSTFSKHFSEQKNQIILELKHKEKIVGILPFEKQNDSLILLGMKEILGGNTITDYGEIIIDKTYFNQMENMWLDLFTFLKKSFIKILTFENVREDSFIFSFLKQQSNLVIEKQETAPFISLPATWEVYLENLNRVERKELKRKLRRLETVSYSFSIHAADKKEFFTDFIRLHRLSNHDKKQFMVKEMEEFFWDMTQTKMNGWNISIAQLDIENRPVAAIFVFENKDQCLLYNSGFDPSFKYYSNGLMLHVLLIKHNIERGIKTHDFLRGNERYKYDLGAQNKNLFKISVSI